MKSFINFKTSNELSVSGQFALRLMDDLQIIRFILPQKLQELEEAKQQMIRAMAAVTAAQNTLNEVKLMGALLTTRDMGVATGAGWGLERSRDLFNFKKNLYEDKIREIEILRNPNTSLSKYSAIANAAARDTSKTEKFKM